MAGLASMFDYGKVQDFVAPRRNMLLGASAGFLSGDLGNVPLYAMEGKKQDDAYATAEKAKADRANQIKQAAAAARASGAEDLAALLESGLDVGEATNLYGAMKPPGGPDMTADIQNYEYSLQNPGFNDYQTQRGGAAEISLTPTWGIDEDPNSPTFNKLVLGQLGKDNKFHRTDMGGVQPVDPAQMAADKKTAVVDADTAGKARAALPGAQQAVTIAQKAIDLVRTGEAAGLDEQFGNTLGVPNRNLPVVPGMFHQEKGNWQVAFAQAQAQGFMQARNMLKGGGPITDYEGIKGELAYSRMQKAVEIGDKDAFLLALDDFEAAVKDGYAKLEATAAGGYSQGAPAMPRPPGGGNAGPGWTVIGVE